MWIFWNQNLQWNFVFGELENSLPIEPNIMFQCFIYTRVFCTWNPYNNYAFWRNVKCRNAINMKPWNKPFSHTIASISPKSSRLSTFFSFSFWQTTHQKNLIKNQKMFSIWLYLLPSLQNVCWPPNLHTYTYVSRFFLLENISQNSTSCVSCWTNKNSERYGT